MAALLPPAAGETSGWSLLGAVAVTAHGALLVIAAWIYLCEYVVFLGGGGGAVGGRCRCLVQQSGLDGVGLGARL